MALGAVIDIGTNSVKLLAAETGAAHLHPVLDELRVTRLGEGLYAAGRLQPEPMRRTLLAVQELVTLARAEGAEDIVAVGTMGLRTAANAGEFLEAVCNTCGLAVQVIPGKEEARLAYLGATAGLAEPNERILLFDTGGGSTELVRGTGGHLHEARSLDLGCAVLSERFLPQNPVPPAMLSNLLQFLDEQLAAVFPDYAPQKVIGVGGVCTSLAAMRLGLAAYDAARIHGQALPPVEAERLLRQLAGTSVEQRRHMPGLHPARAEVIVGGVAVVVAVLRRWPVDRLTVSDHGLRHGVWWERYGKEA